MLKKILLDNLEFHFTKSYLPTLIHGEEHVGASLFTLTMLADLYTQGSKVIALTAYPMAIEEFDKQTGSDENMQFFTKEKTDEFINCVSETSDIDDYIILIKNIELFSEEVFNSAKNLNNLILSGDINNCSFKDALLLQPFTTKIYFSPLDEPLNGLQKYQGLLVSEKHKGVLSVEV